ncbi:MAG: hypothetical protein A2Y55_03970 [Actinobacteria bacterium RBG_16_68_12]|nr:MAG: hypothetical protein A2Y55_03970 [Actinobacteria bacterium RBG_16_68_12]
MTIYTKRNALVGYVTLKAASRALERRRRRKQLGRNAWKIVFLVVLGLVSLGILAGLAAVALRHQREPRRLEGYAVAEDVEGEIVGEYVAAGPEPIPST